MSRYIGGVFADPEIEYSETVFTEEEILENQIQEHLANEENELEKIKHTDRWLNEK